MLKPNWPFTRSFVQSFEGSPSIHSRVFRVRFSPDSPIYMLRIMDLLVMFILTLSYAIKNTVRLCYSIITNQLQPTIGRWLFIVS